MLNLKVQRDFISNAFIGRYFHYYPMTKPHLHVAGAPRRIDYKRELNPAQYQAVTTTEGPVLVIAGAGSGKTRTLVYRLAYLVEEQGVDPENILLLTFTRKSAKEMLTRAAELLERPLTQVMGGTFHSICYHWLRLNSKLLGYPDGFSVMDRDDQGTLLAHVKDQLGLKSLPGPFPRKETLADILGAAVNKNLALETVLARDYTQFLDQEPHIRRMAEAYADHKRTHGLMDYDDLLLEGRRLLAEHEDVRQSLSARYRYIMVDEYQDTNHLQAELVRLLAFTHKNVMAVGDDCQSIYSFRGANFRNIMDFPGLFPGTKIVKLEENYRSTQPILDLANTVIAEAREKYTKCLFSRQPDGAKPRLYRAANENEQSRLVVAQVEDLHGQGVPLHQMAVLFRAGVPLLRSRNRAGAPTYPLHEVRRLQVHGERPRQGPDLVPPGGGQPPGHPELEPHPAARPRRRQIHRQQVHRRHQGRLHHRCRRGRPRQTAPIWT